MKMTRFELKKFFILPVLAFLAVILFLKYMNYLYTPKTSYNFSTEIYNEYIEEIRTLSFDEQGSWLEKEQDRLNNIISRNDEMTDAYTTGKIGLDEFSSYQSKYAKAQMEFPAFNEISHKYEYYQTLESKGVETEFFYDLTVRDYISYLAKADYFFIAFVIFTVAQMLSMDKENKMHEMVISSANGRLNRYKLTAIFLFIFLSFLTTAAVDIILYFRDNSNELLNYKVCNIEMFSVCGYTVTILKYIIFTLLMKMIWSIALGYFVYLVYILADNKIICLVINTAAIYIPIMLKSVLKTTVSRCFMGVQLCGDSFLTSNVKTSIIFLTIYVILISVVLIVLRQYRTKLVR